MTNFAAAHINMVECQIRPNRVTDGRLIDAMKAVPRELFVPEGLQGIAYFDGGMPVNANRRLLEPMLLARMIQAAEIAPNDLVLDIGCATGYSSAILARLARAVVALEVDTDLFDFATKALAAQLVDSALPIKAQLAAGHPAKAPYDVILINGAVAEVPEEVLTQLADGGRLVTVVACKHAIARMGRVMLFRRTGPMVSSTTLFEAAAPMMPGFEFKRGFAF
ncbi:MAG: protein-L-isoaspartate O-methyltransferase [Rhodospirillaceae bacterium]